MIVVISIITISEVIIILNRNLDTSKAMHN